MTNILPLAMCREYTYIVFFWKCLYDSYDVNVSFFSDVGFSTCNSSYTGF